MPLALILISYGAIAWAVLRINSAIAWRKALGTCSSHLTVVTIFYSLVISVYLQPPNPYAQKRGKFFGLFYSVGTPSLNPLIYTLRNKKVKRALRRLLGKDEGSRESWARTAWCAWKVRATSSWFCQEVCFPHTSALTSVMSQKWMTATCVCMHASVSVCVWQRERHRDWKCAKGKYLSLYETYESNLIFSLFCISYISPPWWSPPFYHFHFQLTSLSHHYYFFTSTSHFYHSFFTSPSGFFPTSLSVCFALFFYFMPQMTARKGGSWSPGVQKLAQGHAVLGLKPRPGDFPQATSQIHTVAFIPSSNISVSLGWNSEQSLSRKLNFFSSSVSSSVAPTNRKQLRQRGRPQNVYAGRTVLTMWALVPSTGSMWYYNWHSRLLTEDLSKVIRFVLLLRKVIYHIVIIRYLYSDYDIPGTI